MTVNVDFPLEVVRTKRTRTASISIEHGVVRLRVPRNLSDERVSDLVLKRVPWIKQKLKLQSAKPPPKIREYVNGEEFPYLGRNYRLKLVSGEFGEVKLKNGCMQVSIPKEVSKRESDRFVKSCLAQWYSIHALDRLSEKTERYASKMRVSPTSVKVKEYKSRWGSCSAGGDISYNWRIVLAPHRIVDYVVVHELCHLIEHNHSKRYWHQIEKVLPDYRSAKEWLRENGLNLSI